MTNIHENDYLDIVQCESRHKANYNQYNISLTVFHYICALLLFVRMVLWLYVNYGCNRKHHCKFNVTENAKFHSLDIKVEAHSNNIVYFFTFALQVVHLLVSILDTHITLKQKITSNCGSLLPLKILKPFQRCMPT